MTTNLLRLALRTVASLLMPLSVAASDGAAAPVAGTVLGVPIRAADADVLRDEVLRALTDRHATQQGITVTPAEIDAWVDAVRRGLERERQKAIGRRDGLAQRLAASGLPVAEREALALERDAAAERVRALDSLDAGASAPADSEARRVLAEAFVRQWKINRALYLHYGGRIAYQQGGPAPFDADRRFLEEQQARGGIGFATPEIEAQFWSCWRDESRHSFYVPGSREEAQALAVPPWQVP